MRNSETMDRLGGN